MTSYEFRTYQIQETYNPKGQGAGREYLNEAGLARIRDLVRRWQARVRWYRAVGQADW